MKKVLLFAFCVLGVFGQKNKTKKSSTPEDLEEIDSQSPQRVIFPDNDLEKGQKLLKELQIKNEHLVLTLANVTNKCEGRLKTQYHVYYELLKSSNITQNAMEIERNVSIVYEMDERLDKLTVQVKSYLKILRLKYKILSEDIRALHSRNKDDYKICKEHSSLINFHPEDTDSLATRSLPRRVTITETRKDISRLLMARKRALLNVQIQEKLFTNKNLRIRLVTYAGYCKRKLEHVKQMIHSLERLPKIESLSTLKVLYMKIQGEMVQKQRLLVIYRRDLRYMYKKVTVLQEQYDKMRDAARCFQKLDEWHVVAAMKKVEVMIEMVLTKQDS